MKMFLVDAGNTRIKWAIWESSAPAGIWESRGEVPTTQAPALRPAVQAARAAGVSFGVFCSVAGTETTAEIAAALRDAGIGEVVRFRSLPRVGPLRNGYDDPEQLGADRLAAALGAWQRVGCDAIVVGAGTATTIDVLRRVEGGADSDASAVFAGGVILPGLDLMRSALARNTARLPLAEGYFRTVPGNTDDAIESGCLQAQLGAIGRMRALLPEGSPCVLGGGAAPRLMPLLDAACVLVPDLVLEGLAAAILHGFHR